MYWIAIAAGIVALGGIISASIFSNAMKQRKPCANTSCKYQGSHGFCYHNCPGVSAKGECSSYEEYKYY